MYFKMADGILAGQPISWLPNGYPLLISFVKLFVPLHAQVPFLFVLNVILSTSLIVFTYAIAMTLIGNTGMSLLAAAMIAFLPNQLNYTRLLLTEVPATFLLTLATLFALKRKYFISGLLCPLAALFRSTLTPLAPMLLCAMLMARVSWRNSTRFFFALLLCTSLIETFNLLDITKPPTNFSWNVYKSINGDDWRLESSLKKFPTVEEHPLLEYEKFARKEPLHFIVQRLTSFWDLWGFWPRNTDPLSHRNWFLKMLIGLRFPLLCMAVWGFISRQNESSPNWPLNKWILFLPILLITAIHTLTYSHPRYTFPVEPMTVVLAIVPIFNVITKNKKARLRHSFKDCAEKVPRRPPQELLRPRAIF